MKQNNHGGHRPGSGNPGTPRVGERRAPEKFYILPSLVAAFRKKHGRGASRRVEEMIKKDLIS